MRISLLAAGLGLLLSPLAGRAQNTNSGTDKFAQLETMLPTPNEYRSANGAPGPKYWQQRADYNIRISLDDAKQAITGSETITYTNLSPDVLPYLWVQLDQNILAKNSMTYATQVRAIPTTGPRSPAPAPSTSAPRTATASCESTATCPAPRTSTCPCR